MPGVSYGLGFGALVIGLIVVMVWGMVRSRSVQCPNCGQYKMHWVTPLGMWSHPDNALGVGAVVVLSGLLAMNVACATLGLLAGIPCLAIGLWQRRTMRAGCSYCRLAISNSEMRSLLAGNTYDGAPSSSTVQIQSSPVPEPSPSAPLERALIECPVCKEHIREGALKCRHCGAELA
jgi:hypothetical protein